MSFKFLFGYYAFYDECLINIYLFLKCILKTSLNLILLSRHELNKNNNFIIDYRRILKQNDCPHYNLFLYYVYYADRINTQNF